MILSLLKRSLVFELETSNFGYLFTFSFAGLCKVFARLDNIGIRHFIKVPLSIFGRLKNQNTAKGDPYKMSNINVVQSC